MVEPVTRRSVVVMDRVQRDVERDELREWLRARGATEEQLAQSKHDSSLVADLALARGDRFSARDAATRTGMSPELIVDIFRSYGVTVPNADAILFTEADLAFIAGEKHVAANTVDEPGEGRAFMRVVANSIDRVAEAAVALYVQGKQEELMRSGAPLVTLAETTTAVIESAEDLGRGLGVLFRHHLRQAIERQRVSQVGVASPDLARVAVGFVDLAGSTALEEELDAGELRVLVNEFEARAFEVAADHGGRVVKFIGDEIMAVALDPLAGCHMMMGLLSECGVGEVRPRGGLSYGEVLFRGGDYYGREVNLAARLVQEAIPGEVLVGCSVIDAVKLDDPDCAPNAGRGRGQVGTVSDDVGNDMLVFEPAGRRLLKGFSDPVSVWSVGTPESPGR